VTAPIIRFGRVTPERLEPVYRRAEGNQVTYDHIGSTIFPTRWPERRPSVHHRIVGSGPTAFAAAVAGLRVWAPQRGIGARIHPPDNPVDVGTTVLIVLPFGPVAIVAPNRIVAVIDEPGVFGFAYGTLPGHPESGEESFVVRQAPDGTVTATVSVDARPDNLPGRLAAPVVTALQRVAIRGYLAALERAAG